jgi:hypothetical protein
MKKYFGMSMIARKKMNYLIQKNGINYLKKILKE